MPKKQMLSPKAQVGFTLIEVLVTLIVVAIGLLGLASLQTIGLRNNISLNSQSQAVWIVADILDRMRSNLGMDSFAEITSTEHNCSNPQSPCSPQQMAENDLWELNQAIRSNLIDSNTNIRVLPNSSITVCLDSDPYDGEDCANNSGNTTLYMIKIEWDDIAEGGGRQKEVMTYRKTQFF